MNGSARSLLGVGAAIATLILGASAATAQSPVASVAATGMTIAPPGSEPLGVSYGDWAGRWWHQLLIVPSDTNPAIIDACDTNLVDDVLFRPQTFCGTTLATTCHITEGQAVLASAGGTLCDDIDGTTPTEVDMVRCVDVGRTTLSGARVTIDGVDIPDIGLYWALSPVVDVTYPEGNLFEIPATSAKGVGGGWFAMISGLAPGTHEIVVHDDATDAGETSSAEVMATVVVAPK